MKKYILLFTILLISSLLSGCFWNTKKLQNPPVDIIKTSTTSGNAIIDTFEVKRPQNTTWTQSISTWAIVEPHIVKDKNGKDIKLNPLTEEEKKKYFPEIYK